jgi:hypothetical protein
VDPWEAAIFVEEKLWKFEQNETIPIGLVQKLIADSAYWYAHPRGPAKAPKHFERITVGAYGWEVPFGANSFLVEQAMLRCNNQVRSALAVVSNTDKKFPSLALREQLATSVRGAVSNYLGEEYQTLWAVTNGHMRFGAQSIHVGDFIFSYWQLAHLGLITE